MSSSSKS